MTNQYRRKRIAELKELIQPLGSDRMIASFRYNYLIKSASNSKDTEKEIAQLKQQLEEWNKEISILFKEMRELQVRYFVEYDGEVFESGMPKTVFNKKEFFLSTLADIDTYKAEPELTNDEVRTLLIELMDYIYLQEYSKFTIHHIKRL